MEPDSSGSKTLIFMSVDIAGATTFKERAQSLGENPLWLEAFETFFREFPLVFTGKMAVEFIEIDHLPKVEVWRVLGDEMIFCAYPSSPEEALHLVEAFYRSVVKYDSDFFARWPLRIKGCCWAATFPGRNIEIDIPEMSGGGIRVVDFLGPDVDTGFRLTKFVTGGHLILSLNLAEALASLGDLSSLRFHYIGREVLKGIYSGRPYPLILATLADCMPDLWQWEEEEDPNLRVTRDDPPMEPKELVELSQRIRKYMNQMCKLNLTPLIF